MCRTAHVIRHVGERFSGKVKHAQHAIDIQKFSPIRRRPDFWSQYGLEQESVKVLYVGRDERRKGIVELIEAIADSARPGLPPADYVFVGMMSDETKRDAALHRNIHLLGFRSGDELADIYANSDISVVPSAWENSLSRSSKALRVACPSSLLTPGDPGDRGARDLDLVRIAESGVHLSGAPAVLAEAIASLICRPSLRARLSAGARAKAERDPSEERLGNDWMRRSGR